MGWSLTLGTWRRKRVPVPKENIITLKIAPFAAPSATKVGERDPRGTPQSGGPASSFAFSRCSRTWLGCLSWSGAFSLLSSPRDFGEVSRLSSQAWGSSPELLAAASFKPLNHRYLSVQ